MFIIQQEKCLKIKKITKKLKFDENIPTFKEKTAIGSQGFWRINTYSVFNKTFSI